MNIRTLTEEMVLNALDAEQIAANGVVIILIIIIIVSAIIVGKKILKESNNAFNKKKHLVVSICMVLLALLVIILPGRKLYERGAAIRYSIKNNCWEVDQDTITKSGMSGGGDSKSYYIVLSKYGKVSINKKEYYRYVKGDSVYVILIKDKNGKTYVSKNLYSTEQYIYEK